MKKNFALQLAAAAGVLLGVFGGSSAEAAKGQELVYFYPHTGEVKSATEIRSADRSNAVTKSTKAPGGSITWNITYLDGAGVGFNDPTHGADRKAVVDAVLAYIDSVLDTPVARTVDIDVAASLNSGTASDPLATCGAGYILTNGYQNGDVYRRIVDNVDDFPADADMTLTVDFGHSWHNSLASIPGAPTQWDLYSVLLHEFTHGLGIASLASATGDSQFAPTAAFTGWDNLLHQSSGGTKIWSAAASPAFQLAAGDLDVGDNTLDFRGTFTQAEFGSFPAVYSPATYAQGSSISHWQQAAPIPAGTVMRPGVPNNAEIRTYQPFEIEALRDLGYAVETTSVSDWTIY